MWWQVKTFILGIARAAEDWPLSETLQNNETALQQFTDNMIKVEDTDGDGKVSLKEFISKHDEEEEEEEDEDEDEDEDEKHDEL